ncbi:MAG: hypothetical protein KGJ78_07775 [Alphaproteobacteria bacterium]|nr:hypothetical protein [Alphaproteobacteria bacterium]
MTTSDKKFELLRAFLGGLPEHAAVRLARAVEIDRLLDGKALPHDLILDSLRPMLSKSSMVVRTPTPLRLFCRPFEDLLYSGPHKEKQKGRIMRANVVPTWNWLSSKVIHDEVRLYADEVRSLVVGGRAVDALDRACRFWPVAGEALRHALQMNPTDARAALGGDVAVADAHEMALMLLAGSSMLAVQALMPRRMPSMSEETVWELRRIYDQVVATVVDAAPFVPVVAMRRLAKPWEALKLALNVTRQTQDTLISSTDMGLVGDILFADLEDHRAAIMATRHPNFDVDAFVLQLTGFTNISSAIVKEVEILRRGKWGQRLLSDRAAVGSVMDTFMERAPKEIAAALPTHRSGYTGGPRVPDFSRLPDADRIDRARRYGRLLAATKLLAVPGSFGAKYQDAVDEAMQVLRGYNEDVIKELRSADGARREIVEHQYQLALELTQCVFGDEEAELLRRRGKAAAAPAAAA